MPGARLFLLGRFRLETSEGEAVEIKGLKARALMCFLAMTRDARVDRARIAEMLWSEARDPKGSLRQVFRELRGVIDPHFPGLLSGDRLQISLNSRLISVDAWQVLGAVRTGSRALAETLETCRYGDLFDGHAAIDPVFDEWLDEERRHVRVEVQRGAEAGLELAQKDGAEDHARQFANTLLSIDNTLEIAHRALIKLALDRGDVSGAHKQFRECSTILSRELDVDPSEATVALLEDMKAPGRPVDLTAAARAGLDGLIVSIEDIGVRGGGDSAHVGLVLADCVRFALSRFRWITVIDESVRGGPVNGGLPGAPGTISPRHFTMGGWCLPHGDMLRLHLQVCHLESGRIVWSQQYDRPHPDLLTLVDDVAGQVSAHLDREMRIILGEQAGATDPEDADPFDSVMRAIPLIFRMTEDSFNEAERWLRRAESQDKRFSPAYSWGAFLSFIRMGQGWSADVQSDHERINEQIRRSMENSPGDDLGMAIAGHVQAFVNHEYETALNLFDQSLKLNPNSAYAWALSAITHCYTGDPNEAINRLDRYREIWPVDPYPYFFDTARCIACALAGRYEESVQVGRRVLDDNRNFNATYRPMIASLGHLGRSEEAARLFEVLRRREPEFSIEWFKEKYPPLLGDYSEQYIAGLRLAGVPEKAG